VIGIEIETGIATEIDLHREEGEDGGLVVEPEGGDDRMNNMVAKLYCSNLRYSSCRKFAPT
jgi:hypothetical protein